MMFRYFCLSAFLFACSDTIDDEFENRRLALSNEKELEATRFQSEEEAEAQDLQIIADSRGLTFEEAAAHQRVTEEAGRIGALVAAVRPDIFLGRAARLGEEPVIYVKGTADPALQKLVASSSIPIRLSDGHPFSMAEMLDRQAEVTDVLKRAGFSNFANGIDILDSTLKVKVTRKVGLPDDEEGILKLLPSSLRSLTRISVGDDQAFTPDTSFGGLGTNVGCTTAFSVIDGLGTTGVVSAGHCSNATSISHPPTSHTLTFRREHKGAFGDVEFLTSNVTEPPQFFASPILLRTVTSVRPFANMGMGDAVCLYSRVNAVRTCSFIDTLQEDCIDDGITYSRMVKMDTDVAASGDSGTNWSASNAAWGIHGGSCGGGDAWTVAANLPQALAVNVLQ